MISHYSTFFLNMQWAEVDSNHRSKLQQIYSLSPLATRESTHMKFYCLLTDIIQINCLMQADDRTRTDNLLITNQLLCQLSHIGIYHQLICNQLLCLQLTRFSSIVEK